MNTPDLSATLPVAAPRASFTRFTLVRLVLAFLAVCIPVLVVLVTYEQIRVKGVHAYWPTLLAAAVGFGGYALYVRKVEKRPLVEFARAGALPELAAGLALGALLFAGTLGIVAAIADYRISGMGAWTAVTKSAAEMVFVALVEEILFRGVFFRIPERSLGTWPALAISVVIFALAHVPNDGVTAIAIVNTAIAGAMLGAAYLATRRLWLAVGLHFAWNFVADGVFSLPVSGHPARGLLQGHLAGPDWLTGGAYGLEGSAIALVVLTLATVLLLRHAIRAGAIVSRADAQRAMA
jgi:membrane protease YdiL (CAAX protease family)